MEVRRSSTPPFDFGREQRRLLIFAPFSPHLKRTLQCYDFLRPESSRKRKSPKTNNSDLVEGFGVEEASFFRCYLFERGFVEIFRPTKTLLATLKNIPAGLETFQGISSGR